MSYLCLILTSIQERIQQAMKKNPVCYWVLTTHQENHKKKKQYPFDHNDYLTLVDWSDRAILDNKRGAIVENLTVQCIKSHYKQCDE